ncbi:MAG: NUDIX hydrolase, partial [Janthinobacterium lividum]
MVGHVEAESLGRMAEPDWLTWTRELQAIAQTGLAFVRDPYDRERYEMLRTLASRIMAAHTASSVRRIEELFAGETGYATPKVDVRGAAFDESGRMLMVREVADAGRWTLPGGWADVNLTAAENVVKE